MWIGKRAWLQSVLLVLAIPACPDDRGYQAGILAGVSNFSIDDSVLFGVRGCCIFHIQADGLMYKVSLSRRRDEIGWSVNGSIFFRVNRHHVFIRAANGRDVKGKLLKISAIDTRDPKSNQPNATADARTTLFDLPPPLPGPSKFNPVIPMDLDILKGGSGCIQVSASLTSGDFFKDFRSRRSKNGRDFRNASGHVHFFPERLTVEVLISLLPCAPDQPQESGGPQPHFTFDKTFAESLFFQGFWKDGLDSKKADVRLLDRAENCRQSSAGYERCSWQYELSVWSNKIPLSEVLVVEILTGDGKSFTRFTSSSMLKN